MGKRIIFASPRIAEDSSVDRKPSRYPGPSRKAYPVKEAPKSLIQQIKAIEQGIVQVPAVRRLVPGAYPRASCPRFGR
jgi:hypothetical protein